MAKRVLFMSDGHRGATISNLAAYEKSLLAAMRQYDHVVINGDWFELMFVHELEAIQKSTRRKHVLREAIKESKTWLEAFLKDNPQTQVHFVLGNHENLKKFRNTLDRLQKKYDNFEWDPEAIRLGDALITHGDLQINHQTDKKSENQGKHEPTPRPISRLRDCEKGRKWSKTIIALGDGMAHRLWAEQQYAPGKAVDYLHRQLKRRCGKEDFFYRFNHERHAFTMDWVKHVFFGHTHVRFMNEQCEGIYYHNTGAFTKTVASQANGLGILQATLRDGEIHDVKPAPLYFDERHIAGKIVPLLPRRGGNISLGGL